MDDTSWDNSIPDLSGQLAPVEFKQMRRGGYSNVFPSSLNGDPVAVKVIYPINNNIQSMRRKIMREGLIWSKLDHPNILPLLGFADDDSFQPFGAFVSPWCPNGNSEDYLSQRGSSIGLEGRLDLLLGSIEGAFYLHGLDPPIIHGDLKPANILIDQYGIPKLCDFGLSSTFLSEGTSGLTTTTAHTGTERYLAPELVESEEISHPTRESDVYAMGCVGLKFIFMVNPYEHRQNNIHGHIIRDILDGIPPASFQEGMDRPHQSLSISLSNTWNKVPSERPTMFGLLSEIRYVKVLEVSTKGDESPGDLEDGSSTFPNASIATLSAFSEETDRHSGYNSSPSPNAGTTTKHYLPASNPDHYPLRPFSGGSVNRRNTKDIRDGWDTESLDYIPPAPRKDTTSSLDHVPPVPPREASISPRNRDLPPTIREAPTSSLNHPPTRPVKRSTSASRALPIMPIMYMNEGPKLLRTGSEAGLAGIGASRKYHRRITSVVVPGVRSFASPYPSVSSPVVGFIGNESGRPPIAPKPLPPSQRNKVSNGRDLDDLPGGSTSYQNSGHVATRSWSGEQRGTGPTNSMATIMNDDSTDFHPLVAVEERFPYLQGPSARGSTGSVNSVHSNRLRFDPNEYVDPAFLVVTDLTEALEKRIGPPPLLPNEEPATSLVTKAAKRVSKVLRLGRYNK